MPRTTRYKRYRKNRKSNYKRGGSRLAKPMSAVQRIAGSVSKLWRGYNMLRGLINVEWKKLITTDSGTVTNGATIIPLSLVAQGDTYNTRSGNSILGKSLMCNLFTERDSGGIDEQHIRVVIFKDSDSRETVPTITDIFTANTWSSGYNVVGKEVKRFKILYDKTHIVGATSSPYSTVRRTIIRLKLYGHITYDDTTAAQDAALRGHYYMILIGNQTTSNYPTYTLESRITFIDN